MWIVYCIQRDTWFVECKKSLWWEARQVTRDFIAWTANFFFNFFIQRLTSELYEKLPVIEAGEFTRVDTGINLWIIVNLEENESFIICIRPRNRKYNTTLTRLIYVWMLRTKKRMQKTEAVCPQLSYKDHTYFCR